MSADIRFIFIREDVRILALVHEDRFFARELLDPDGLLDEVRGRRTGVALVNEICNTRHVNLLDRNCLCMFLPPKDCCILEKCAELKLKPCSSQNRSASARAVSLDTVCSAAKEHCVFAASVFLFIDASFCA